MRRLLRPGNLYVLACLVLALVWIAPAEPNHAGFFALFLILLPLSLVVAYGIQFVGGAFIFAPDERGILFRLLVVTIWVGVAVLYVFLIRRLRHRRAPN